MHTCMLVLAHKLEETLALVGHLQDPRFFFLIHFDANSPADPAPLTAYPNVRLLPDRLPTFWGGFNLTRVALGMLDHAFGMEAGFRRYCLVSGDALPLGTPDELHDRLSRRDREFIQIQPTRDVPGLRGVPKGRAAEITGRTRGSDQAWRFANYSFLDNVLVNPRSDALERLGLTPLQAQAVRRDARRLVDDIFAALPPRPRLFPRLFSGSHWWGLGADAVAFARQRAAEPEVQDYFRFMWIPDEHLFHCILGNSAHLGTERAPFMFTDWRKRHADRDSTIDLEDLRRARAQGYLFARKYDHQHCPDIRRSIQMGTLIADIAAGDGAAPDGCLQRHGRTMTGA